VEPKLTHGSNDVKGNKKISNIFIYMKGYILCIIFDKINDATRILNDQNYEENDMAMMRNANKISKPLNIYIIYV